MRTAIFLERDGILSLDRLEQGQLRPPLLSHQLQPNLAAVEPLRRLKAMGFLLIATTNQPGVPRRELDRMNLALTQLFYLDDFLVCQHDPEDHCPCRKPRPGLFTEAAYKWRLSLDQSFVVSNKWQDAEAARNAGCTSLLVASPWIGKGHHDIVLQGLADVPRKIAQFQHAPLVMA